MIEQRERNKYLNERISNINRTLFGVRDAPPLQESFLDEKYLSNII
jgi:hypothetical protein